MHKVEIQQSKLTKVIDYLKWVEAMPDSLKEDTDTEGLERAVFHDYSCGYVGDLNDAIDATDILEYPASDYLYTITLKEDDIQMLLDVDGTDIQFEFVPI